MKEEIISIFLMLMCVCFFSTFMVFAIAFLVEAFNGDVVHYARAFRAWLGS